MSIAQKFNDEELGFIGAAAAGAGKLIGGLGKGLVKALKKKKKKKPAVSAPAGTNPNAPDRPDYLMPLNQSSETKAALASIVKGAAKAKSKARAGGADAATVREIVTQIVAQVPAAVQKQVLEALKTAKNAEAGQQQVMDTITSQVDASLKPQVTAMLAALQAQGLSRQATSEHQSLVKKADFERSVTDGLAATIARMGEVEQNMTKLFKNPKVAIVTQKLPIFGPKNVLEG